jgi:hypothetical protein
LISTTRCKFNSMGHHSSTMLTFFWCFLGHFSDVFLHLTWILYYSSCALFYSVSVGLWYLTTLPLIPIPFMMIRILYRLYIYTSSGPCSAWAQLAQPSPAECELQSDSASVQEQDGISAELGCAAGCHYTNWPCSWWIWVG